MALTAVSRRHAHVHQHRDQFGLLRLRMHAEGAPLDADLGVDLLVGGLTDVYSPSAIENAPATRPAKPLSTTVCALAAAADAGNQCGVADKTVHRAERRGPQPTAADVAVPVIEACAARRSARRMPPVPTRSWCRFNATRFAWSSSGLPTFATSQFPRPREGLPSGYDHHCGASTQHAGRPLARREEPDARGTLQRGLPAALHPEHRHRPDQGGASR